MKKFIFVPSFLVGLLVGNVLSVRIGINDESNYLCDAINSIIELDVFTLPLSIQSRDQSIDYCIDTGNVTVLVNLVTNETRLISGSSIVIVETKADVLKNLTSLMNYNSNHLIVISGRYTSGDLDELVYQFWRKLLINVSFLLNINSNIFLQTFIPYNEANCNDTMLRTINHFDGKTQLWNTSEFFPKKLNNFYGCTIRIATHKNVIPYIVREETENGIRVLHGRVIQMIDALSSSLNFTGILD